MKKYLFFISLETANGKKRFVKETVPHTEGHTFDDWCMQQHKEMQEQNESAAIITGLTMIEIPAPPLELPNPNEPKPIAGH